MAIDQKLFDMLNAPRYKVTQYVGGGTLAVGIFALFIAIPGAISLMLKGYMNPEMPVIQHPEITVIAWIVFVLCVIGNRLAKKALTQYRGKIEKHLKGVAVDQVLKAAVDPKSSRTLMTIVSLVETEPYSAVFVAVALRNWEDGATQVYESLLEVIGEIKVLAPIQTRKEQGLPPVIVVASFSPLVVAIVLGGVMMTSHELMLNSMLGRLVGILGVTGLILPQLLPLFFITKRDKERKEKGNIKRLSSQQVAWMGVNWGDYAVRELIQRSKDGDASAKTLLKTLNKRRTH